jgi:hypothetical protein
MKFLKKILSKFIKTSKKPKGKCDRCQKPILQADKALCFHADNLEQEIFLCESCIETVYGEHVKELI